MIGKNLSNKLLLMFCMLNKKEYIVLVSKENTNREKQIILLMTPNGEEWHYLAVKKYQRY